MRLLVILTSFLIAINSKANPQKEFIMACSYGVMAGTLVGAATLAFTKNPGQNLNKVARGASLGLYGGIALGLYVVYIVPGQIEKENNELLEAPVESRLPSFMITPIAGDKGIDGIYAQTNLFSF